MLGASHQETEAPVKVSAHSLIAHLLCATHGAALCTSPTVLTAACKLAISLSTGMENPRLTHWFKATECTGAQFLSNSPGFYRAATWRLGVGEGMRQLLKLQGHPSALGVG